MEKVISLDNDTIVEQNLDGVIMIAQKDSGSNKVSSVLITKEQLQKLLEEFSA